MSGPEEFLPADGGPRDGGPVAGEAGVDWQPWTYPGADPAVRARQEIVHADLLRRHPGWSLGEGAFVSALAAVDAEEFALGHRSYLAAHAHVTGRVRTGSDCSLNAACAVRGDVRLGDGVRIGAHAALLGFNHTFADPDRPVFRQPLTSRGITVGDDVWVGSHVVVVDGVHVGDRSVLAAGAVVTKDVPAGAVVGGNPARLLRWRVPPAGTSAPDDLGRRLEEFGARVRSQGVQVLDRSWRPGADGTTGWFLDAPGARLTVRAQCDAVEVADLLLGTAPPQLPAREQADRLRALQDPGSGLVPEVGEDGTPTGPWPAGDDPLHDDPLHDDAALYHVLCVGYALDLLGSTPAHPVRAVTDLDADALLARLDALPWQGRAWTAGHWVDAVATALHRDRGTARPGTSAALFGWLLTHADPGHGAWGRSPRGDSALQVVNGFYRTARGSFGQWGLPLPHPVALVDTVLAHAADPRHFAPDAQDACAVLDVAWPLRIAGRQTDHRRDEVRTLARRLLEDVLPRWRDGEGFAFRAAPAPGAGTDDSRARPGLQGTEMWLAVVWELSALAGLDGALPYRPRGVHRPDPL